MARDQGVKGGGRGDKIPGMFGAKGLRAMRMQEGTGEGKLRRGRSWLPTASWGWLWLAGLAMATGAEAAPQERAKASVVFRSGAGLNHGELPGGTVLYGGLLGERGQAATKQRAKPKQLLLTHLRRDALPTVAAGKSVAGGGRQVLAEAEQVLLPAAEAKQLTEGQRQWSLFRQTRFHDYAQRSTKWPLESLPQTTAVRTLVEGEVVQAGPLTVQVWETPGFSPGAISYLFVADGKRYAATGDLLYAGGRLLDIYSLQDAIAETKTRGYHGYAARAGQLITSLRRIQAWQPDEIWPARGPVIREPQREIALLLSRLEALLRSHFATDALRWYWGEESWRRRAELALGQPAGKATLEAMPMGREEKLPPWVLAIENSRLLLGEGGAAFLLDAGHPKIGERLEELHAAGKFARLEGIWITHYHDDHTDFVARMAKRWNAPVHYSASIAGILERPADYRMPAQTHVPTKGSTHGDGESWQWQGLRLTSFHFPGQTLYHGGLLVENPRAPEILFFIGDSFTPSGLDDYCLLNRNLTGEEEGYLYCLRLVDRLRAKHGERLWLINQHVAPMFQYDEARITRMQSELRKRREILAELTPLPGANYAVDEGWARFTPYALTAGTEKETLQAEGKKAGERKMTSSMVTELHLTNHSGRSERFGLRFQAPTGWRVVSAPASLTVAAGQTGRAKVVVAAEPGAPLGLLTADITVGGQKLRQWTEALLQPAEEEGTQP